LVFGKRDCIYAAGFSAVIFQSAIFLSRRYRYDKAGDEFLIFSLWSIGFAGNVLAELFLNVNPNMIGGKYINVFLLCVLGYVQWFWIVPRLLQSDSGLKVQNLFGRESNLKLSEGAINSAEFCDSQSRTPVERIIYEKDSNR
jgi:hypothetical protein